jgi:hypothetical protein
LPHDLILWVRDAAFVVEDEQRPLYGITAATLASTTVVAKIFTTAPVPCPLEVVRMVGGILAPSLFLGGTCMVGGACHNIVADLFQPLYLATIVKGRDSIAACLTNLYVRANVQIVPSGLTFFELADASANAMVLLGRGSKCPRISISGAAG